MKTSISSSFLRKLLAPLCAAILPAILAAPANAQQSIATPGVAVTQNFDSLGSSATAALPSGWKMGTDWSTGATATGAAAGTSGTGALSSSSSGNFYNFANGVTASSTDRAIGFLTTGSYSSPRSIIYAFQNNTGQTITAITLSWNYEKYRTGTRAFDWTFFHGATSAVATAAADGNQSYTADAAIAVVNPPTSLAKTVTITGLSIAPGATYYLRWTYTGVGGSTNAQALGVDDFSITLTASTNPGINTTGSLTPFSTESGTASAAQTFNATGANLTQNITVTAPTDLEVATDGATFGDTATITQSGGSASGTVSVRIKAAATAGAKSGNIVLSSAGATDVNVPVSGTVTAAGAAVVSLSTTSISNLSTSVGVASAATNYIVTGTNLGTTAVTITPSQAFLEIGTNGSTFASTIDLSPTDGAVSNTVFLRVAATNVVTNYNATISHVSGSASNSLAVSGAITNLPPILAVSTNTLSGFTTTTNVASAAQTFTVAGSNLTTNVTVGAPTGFQVANDGTTWGTNTSVTPVSGSVSNTISVRLAASSVSGPFSGNVTVASTGATQRTVAVSGSVESPSVPGLVYWNFNTATPTSGTNGDYAAWTFGPLTQSNNNGTTPLFTSTSPSSGYTNPFNVLASGTTNAGASARTGAFNAPTNAFFEVQIVVPSNTTTSITNISFGSRSTGTGPAAYSIRSSADGFAADVATNALTTNSTWAMNVAPVAIALSNGTNSIRIYGFGGTGTAQSGTANWRIDDLTLALAAGVGPTPTPPTITSTNAFSGTVGVAFSNDITATGAAPIGFSGTALPGGLSVASGGAITGTPTAAGTFNATLTATNAAGTNNQAVTFTIATGAVSITTPPTASGLVQGQTLASSTLSGGSASVPGTFAWTDSSIIPPVGTTSYGVTFTPTDAANYDTATTDASVTVLSAYQAGYTSWLTGFQLDPLVTTGPNAGAPNADPDNDGFSNASEYAFGTNPTVPNGALLTTTSSNSVFRSSWAGPASGVTYGVQFSTNLSTMAFSNDPTITIESAGGVMSFTNQATGNKFFRVRATSN